MPPIFFYCPSPYLVLLFSLQGRETSGEHAVPGSWRSTISAMTQWDIAVSNCEFHFVFESPFCTTCWMCLTLSQDVETCPSTARCQGKVLDVTRESNCIEAWTQQQQLALNCWPKSRGKIDFKQKVLACLVDLQLHNLCTWQEERYFA